MLTEMYCYRQYLSIDNSNAHKPPTKLFLGGPRNLPTARNTANDHIVKRILLFDKTWQLLNQNIDYFFIEEAM